jgi:hypothetical protein
MSEPDLIAALARCFEMPRPDDPSRKITQGYLAERIGVPPVEVSLWVNRKKPLPIDLVPRIDDACGKRRGWLLTDAGFVELPDSPEAAIAVDPRLDEEYRSRLVLMYEGVVQRLGRAQEPQL